MYIYRLFRLAAALLVITALALVVSPELRAVAIALYGEFFEPGDDDQGRAIRISPVNDDAENIELHRLPYRFNIAEQSQLPTELPEGFSWDRRTEYTAETGNVLVLLRCEQRAGDLYHFSQQSGPASQLIPDGIESTAEVTDLQVGPYFGHYIEGRLRLADSNHAEAWNYERDTQRLWWEANGRAYVISQVTPPHRDSDPACRLSAEQLVTLAASMKPLTSINMKTLTNMIYTPPTPRLIQLTDLQALSVGFTPVVPSDLPDGYVLGERVTFEGGNGSGSITMQLRCQMIEGDGYIFMQQTTTGDWNGPAEVGASAQVEDVQINGIDGQYVIGLWWPVDDAERDNLEFNLEWLNDPNSQQLRWQANGIDYNIGRQVSPTEADETSPNSCLLARDTLVDIAENLKAIGQADSE